MLHSRRAQVTLIGLALVATLTACAPIPVTFVTPTAPSGSEQPDEQELLDGTEWVLISLHGSVSLAGSRTTLEFADGRATGFAGCNGYGAGYTSAADGTITIHEMAITLQFCETPQGVMQQESAFTAALRDASSYSVLDDRLEIVGDSGLTSLVLERREAVSMDPADLLGTAWRLVWMNDLAPGEDTDFTLVFHDEHQISGLAGCRSYIATYEADGDDIAFLSLGMIGDACPELGPLMEREAQYTTMLEQATNLHLAEGRLEILTARGDVLAYEPWLDETRASLQGNVWALAAFVEQRPAEGLPMSLLIPSNPLPETEITATFEQGRVSGSAGCNSYSAAYSSDRSSLSFDTVAATWMHCASPEGIMEQEQRYLSYLEAVTSYRRMGNQLWLQTDEGEVLVYIVKVMGYNLTDLVEDMHAAGLAVEQSGELVDHGFAIKGRLLLVNGIATYVYEFGDVEAAQTAAAGVSADRHSMTVTRLEGGLIVEVHSDWLDTPHVYHRGRLIVISGAGPGLLRTFDRLLGRQVAPGPTVAPTPTPTATARPTATPTATATAPDCTSPEAFPPEQAQLIWPYLSSVQPLRAAPGERVAVRGGGGYLYWDGACGPAWDESARSFQLFFDGEPACMFVCYANMCQADLRIPRDALSGLHTISVEGGSALRLRVERPTSTPTHTATSPPQTSTPTPTFTPTPTPTPTLTPTPTPTATPIPLQILGFAADKMEVNPGESVRLAWDSRQAVRATLSQWVPYGILKQSWSVPPTGTLDVTIGQNDRLWHEFRLVVEDSFGRTAEKWLAIQIRCPFRYFFELPSIWGSDHCPFKPATHPWSAEQPFEHGRMIWLQEIPAESDGQGVARGQTVYVLYYSDEDPRRGGQLEVFVDTWTDAEPESDPSIVAPAGLYQPIRGFGKVWREKPGVRARLGWALDKERGFDGAYQVDWQNAQHPAGRRYIQTADGLIVWLGRDNNWGWLTP